MSELTMTPEEILPWICSGWKDRARLVLCRRKRWTALELIEAGREIGASAKDILHVILRPELVDDRTLRLLACDFAERALILERESGREPDPRSWHAVEVSRRYARGEAKEDELLDACDAAEFAEFAAGFAAESAAWCAARAAAEFSAEFAAWYAADSAEESEWQLAHVEQTLKEEKEKRDE